METNLFSIFALLVAFQVKHFLCDYPLQTPYMLNKFHKDPKIWIPSLTSHACIHAAFTFLISLTFLFSQTHSIMLLPTVGLAIFDFVIHFGQDRLKASPNLLGRFKPDNKLFWWSLGYDQMVHHFTHYIIIYCLLAF